MAADKPTHWADIQEVAFTRWCNNHLEDRGMNIGTLKEDFTNGVALINLLEIISHPKTIPKYNRHPRIPIQKTENFNIALDFIKAQNIKLVNIGASDLVNGSTKLQLGLIWTLILRYEINKGQDRDYNAAKNALLEWIRSKIPEYDIKNFKKDWNDGRALCALNNAIKPGLCPNHRELNPDDKAANAGKGMDLAEENFGIKPLLTPEEMNNPRVDEKAMVAYLAQFMDAQAQDVTDADRSRAYGPGLQEGVAGKDAPFTVETPEESKEKLEVKVVGPANNVEPTITKGDNGVYQCSYLPDVPGDYEVHVTLGGNHVPGSIFKVSVLGEINLGGEGLVIVFFSTTSSTEKGRRDVFDLQRLLEAKKIHERENFVPWTPVDVLTREDREAVFEKCGTRQLPIVLVDDKYIGDYDTIQQLEENGKLNAVLGIK
mmetsp:Transcript_22634/g.63587  ORF Transcript_22634/g.63587 Transcript_22634/m.63587 type:complete len:430 (+) Transcript_22634:105-1394(+)|eukprot:CAMPEP_0119131136 /NCGR_PEP_ID=MMETSP1310-20130426/9538_1 /TAXON_ID=464262 /ORGANISM="Genus nov. species nov., Strain RCC2339" /LENGTH=429 /DNA_ID=CAMNT_0007121689 /DNA_START=66 /DNA_END=1355 /DNA_ORIENTATION=-